MPAAVSARPHRCARPAFVENRVQIYVAYIVILSVPTRGVRTACGPVDPPVPKRPAAGWRNHIAIIVERKIGTYAQISCRGFTSTSHLPAPRPLRRRKLKSLKYIGIIFCLFFHQPNNYPVTPRVWRLCLRLSTKLSTETVGKGGSLMNQGFSAVSADSHP